MNLSEAIIKIHSIAAERAGELEADELVTSLLVIVLNDLKKNGELNPENLIEAFQKKRELVELAHLDFEQKRPQLSLVQNCSQT